MRHLLIALCFFSVVASAAVGAVLVFGQYSFSSIPPASAANSGGIVYDDTAGALKVSNGTGWASLNASTEAVNIIPSPYVLGGAVSGAPPIAAYIGAAYYVTTSVVFSSIAFFVATATGAPDINILIYQAPGGDVGTAKLVASVVNFSTPTPGIYVAPIAEGTAQLEPGRLFILFGSTVNTSTVRAYLSNPQPLFNTNMPAGIFRTSFSTTVVPPSVPATFDPLGASLTAPTSTTAALIVRLLKP